MAQDWFIIRNGKETGPYNAQHLKDMATRGQLTSADLVRRVDMQAAIPASQSQGLIAGQGAVTTAPVTPVGIRQYCPASGELRDPTTFPFTDAPLFRWFVCWRVLSGRAAFVLRRRLDRLAFF
jgi:hypothetical protein